MTIHRALTALACVLALGTVALAAPTLSWSDLHDGGANLNDELTSVIFTPDGNVVSGGMHDPGNGHADIFVRKHDRATGEVIWEYSYAHPTGNDMVVSELILDHRGDIMVAGYLSSCDS